MSEMKTIEVSEETYKKLLELKNRISIKIRSPVLTHDDPFLAHVNGVDLEPEYTFDEFLAQTIKMIWHEQETGKVAFIT